jgi:hypothetical protein
VDTAICAKRGELLAGQLLYGDSMHRSYFVRTGSEGRERDAQTCNLSCQKSTTLPATRGAGLVQIANSLIEKHEPHGRIVGYSYK